MSKDNSTIDVSTKLTRSYIATRQFTDASGKTINYRKLIHVIQIGSKSVDVEVKADRRDLELLELADDVLAA